MGDAGLTKSDPLAADSARDDLLVLVDPLDHELGIASKERVHREGLLHRAFSVVLTRECGGRSQVLLARRASCKYHAAGLWGNSCCSHPREGEGIREAAVRRVHEELGCGFGAPSEIGSFVYRASFCNGMTEYEYDHVLIAPCDEAPHPLVDEVDAIWWVDVDELGRLLCAYPHIFAPWALTVLPMAMARMG